MPDSKPAVRPAGKKEKRAAGGASGGKPTAAKGSGAAAAAAAAAAAGGPLPTAPVGLLAEAEVLGACLAAGQGAGLLDTGVPLLPVEPSSGASKRNQHQPENVWAPPLVAATAVTPPEPELREGAEVRLRGLVAAPELNGAVGLLQEYHEDRDRWAVALPGGGPPKLVRPQNLEVLSNGEHGLLGDPSPCAALEEFSMSLRPLSPCGAEVLGFDARKRPPEAALRELERAMARFGFVLFRGQGTLTGVEQCVLSEMFGTGQLHSTHGVHWRAPNQHIFRLSNDPDEGFNEVGPEWHHDGAFVQNVFGHVVYHIVRAPRCGGKPC